MPRCALVNDASDVLNEGDVACISLSNYLVICSMRISVSVCVCMLLHVVG